MRVIRSEDRRGRAALATLTIVAASSFGPYIAGGLRTEQLVAYICAFVGILFGVGRFRVSSGATAVITCYLVVLVIAILGLLSPPVMKGYSYDFARPLAGIDNLALPVAAVILAQILQATMDRGLLLRRLSQIVVTAMCLNTLVELVSLKFSLSSLLSRFWDSEKVANLSTDTVAGRAAQLGRVSGIFNQPSEAGIIYGAALLMAIYLYREHPKRLVGAALILLAGGFLTVSKIFVLVALPIALWQICRVGGRRFSRLIWLAVMVSAAAFAGAVGLIPAWAGASYLLRLLHPGEGSGLLSFYTSSRFGSGSSVAPIINAVLQTSPVSGIGAQGLNAAYDNVWVEGLVYAGLFGVIGYTVVFFVLARAWQHRRKQMLPGESRLVVGLWLIVVFGSVGFPVLTGNRMTTLLWLAFGITVLAPFRSALLTNRSTRFGPPWVLGIERPHATAAPVGAALTAISDRDVAST